MVPSIDNANVRQPPNGRELDTMEKARSTMTSSSPRRLRIALLTENFLPKVDGVTRTLARLLEHLQLEGHEALVMGPESGMTSYAGHEVIGTKGIPLLGVYKGLKLNFIRPRFIRRLMEFKPDVIQFVDPIWLCAQCIPVIQYWLPDTPLLTSYHTNLAMYATLFGFSWLTPIMWTLQRYLHAQCQLTFCPSPSTARMLASQGFHNVRLWPRGVDTGLFRPEARDYDLRRSWTAEPAVTVTPRASRESSRRSSLDVAASRSPSRLPPPPYSVTAPAAPMHAESKIVMLYVGRVSWEKNLRLLVEAFRGLQYPSEDGSRPACQLVFVGDGPSRPELEALCSSYGLDAVFMGYRKGEELAAAFASADIFAFPSWTETFGQVVLESLASGLPVVGLRAEGVCDLVEHDKTGLLLDLDDLLPTTSSDSIHDLPEKRPVDPVTGFRPLPENPHALVDVNSPTFPLAVGLYRSLLVDLATNHERRHSMGVAAATEAARRSWHGAMEMLVDGYREIARPLPACPSPTLSLSRTSTIEVDVISHLAESDTYAESTAASPSAKRVGMRRVLRLGGVFRRTGGRLKKTSISKPLRTWLSGKDVGTTEAMVQAEPLGAVAMHSKPVWATRWVVKVALLLFGIYFMSVWAKDTLSSQTRLSSWRHVE